MYGILVIYGLIFSIFVPSIAFFFLIQISVFRNRNSNININNENFRETPQHRHNYLKQEKHNESENQHQKHLDKWNLTVFACALNIYLLPSFGIIDIKTMLISWVHFLRNDISCSMHVVFIICLMKINFGKSQFSFVADCVNNHFFSY